MIKKLRIATRTSALALAQTRIVADMLHDVMPDLEIEVVGVRHVTGDLDKKTPLSQLGTVGVFTKEIDEMILSGEADCAVHSLKDIGTVRPGTLRTVAVPKRAQPHDCILFHPDIIERIKAKKKIIIGASSPRRALLIPRFLKQALPQFDGHQPDVEVVPLRGNVPSRIQKMLGLKECEEQLDGVALAFAGLSRLHADPDAHEEIETLLTDLKWMVIPLTACPGAPGQGALAIEALDERKDVIDILSKIHDRKQAANISLERNILIEQGGGCHQSFGATTVSLEHSGDNILIIRGDNKNGVDISETRWLSPQDDIPFEKVWNGMKWRNDIFKTDYLDHPHIEGDAVFVSHSRAVPDDKGDDMRGKRIWTAGVKSWCRLAQKGLWIEGCADGFGYDHLIKTLLCDPVLSLPQCPAWNILTHEDAAQNWHNMGTVIPTYRVQENISDEAIESLKNASHIYWSSYAQYLALHEHAKKDAVHMCGPGKTADLLTQSGVQNLVISPYFAYENSKKAS